MQSSADPTPPSPSRLRGPILALVAGVLLTLEMFQVPLYSIFTGIDIGLRPSGSRPWMPGDYLVPLVNLVLMVCAGALLVRHGPMLGTAQRACLMFTSVVGTGLAGMQVGYVWSLTELGRWYNRLDLVSGTAPLEPAVFLHSLVVIAWLAWFSGQYRQSGRTSSQKRARGAAWAVTIALACAIFSDQHLSSPALLLIGLTALLFATGQAARMASGNGEAAPSETIRPEL